MNTPSLSLDALKPIAGLALESALNHVIALDPDTHSALSQLEGKRIELCLQSPALALAMTVRQGKLEVGPSDAAQEPDLGLRATLGAVLSQLPFAKSANRKPVGKFRINGDVDLARTLQQLAERFDPDWEKPFAEMLGPIFGPQVARALREGLRSGSQLAKNIAKDAAEYLTEETKDVIAKAELSAFYDDVDALRDRVERLIARVEKLRAASGGTA